MELSQLQPISSNQHESVSGNFDVLSDEILVEIFHLMFSTSSNLVELNNCALSIRATCKRFNIVSSDSRFIKSLNLQNTPIKDLRICLLKFEEKIKNPDIKLCEEGMQGLNEFLIDKVGLPLNAGFRTKEMNEFYVLVENKLTFSLNDSLLEEELKALIRDAATHGISTLTAKQIIQEILIKSPSVNPQILQKFTQKNLLISWALKLKIDLIVDLHISKVDVKEIGPIIDQITYCNEPETLYSYITKVEKKWKIQCSQNSVIEFLEPNTETISYVYNSRHIRDFQECSDILIKETTLTNLVNVSKKIISRLVLYLWRNLP